MEKERLDEITKDMSSFGAALFQGFAIAQTACKGSNPDEWERLDLHLVKETEIRDNIEVGSEPGSTDGKR